MSATLTSAAQKTAFDAAAFEQFLTTRTEPAWVTELRRSSFEAYRESLCKAVAAAGGLPADAALTSKSTQLQGLLFTSNAPQGSPIVAASADKLRAGLYRLDPKSPWPVGLPRLRRADLDLIGGGSNDAQGGAVSPFRHADGEWGRFVKFGDFFVVTGTYKSKEEAMKAPADLEPLRRVAPWLFMSTQPAVSPSASPQR